MGRRRSLPVAVALGRVLAFFLRGVTVGQLSTYLGVSLVLLVVTLLANFIPARRATKVAPMAALRYEQVGAGCKAQVTATVHRCVETKGSAARMTADGPTEWIGKR